MTRRWRKIVTLSFHGPRFEDHAIEIPALVELLHFQDLVKDVAKSLFRREHPEAGRLPNRFDEMLTLRFSQIEGGSTRIPLEACEEYDELVFEFLRKELPAESAANLIHDSVRAAAAERSLPERFPRPCLTAFAELGRSLGPEDSIVLATPQRPQRASYSMQVRSLLGQLVSSPYTDVVKLSGKVLAADVRRGRFYLYPSGQSEIPVSFDESQEDVVLRALKEHRSAEIHLEGKAEYTPEGTVRQILGVASLSLEPERLQRIGEEPPIWEKVQALGRELPQDVTERLPQDASARLDEYLYGETSK